MRLRRKRILSVLRPGEVAPTMTCFPLMGVGDFVSPTDTDPSGDADAPAAEVDIKMPPSSPLPRHGGPGEASKWHVRGPVANSAYIPDAIINPHPRFGALTRNIRVRNAVVMLVQIGFAHENHEVITFIEFARRAILNDLILGITTRCRTFQYSVL